MPEEMVVIRTYSSEFEAELAREELESANIAVHLLSDGLSTVLPALQFARGIRLAVRAVDAAAAIELLDAVGEE